MSDGITEPVDEEAKAWFNVSLAYKIHGPIERPAAIRHFDRVGAMDQEKALLQAQGELIDLLMNAKLINQATDVEIVSGVTDPVP